MRAKKIAMEEGLNYVFVGNVRGGEEEDTVCPSCGTHVVKRRGYTISEWNLDDEMKCTKCGAHIPILGQLVKHSDNWS